MRFAYADPPYPGMARLYRAHQDYAGEVDHADLIARLVADYDGWALHTASVTLREVLALCPSGVRVMAWVKSFASWKPGNWPAYAWEPVILAPLGRPAPRDRATVADFMVCPIALRKGLVGAKPAAVIEWVFRAALLEPNDELADLYPGTGVVERTWRSFSAQTVCA